MQEGSPLFSFGVIADIQHADLDNAYNYHRTFMRFYRHALEKFKEAVTTWNESKVDFAVQLGDIIDGFSKEHGHRDKDFQNLLDVVREFKSTGLSVRKVGDVYVPIEEGEEISPYMCHLWGNHEFYNFSRSELWKSDLNSFVVPRDVNTDLDLNSADINSSHGYYYSFSHVGIRFIALDPYDIGKISRPEGSDLHKVAMETLGKFRKNKDDYIPGGRLPHIVSWNGALSNAQLSWLHNELAVASKENEKVIILSHVPLHALASRAASVIWNYPDVLHMINSFECVVACLAGHFHEGGYFHDREHNIHHLTLPGVIERDPATNSYAVIEVYKNCLKVNGFGKLKTRELKF